MTRRYMGHISQCQTEMLVEPKAAEDVCTLKKGDVLGQYHPNQLAQLARPTTRLPDQMLTRLTFSPRPGRGELSPEGVGDRIPEGGNEL